MQSQTEKLKNPNTYKRKDKKKYEIKTNYNRNL